MDADSAIAVAALVLLQLARVVVLAAYQNLVGMGFDCSS